MSPKWCCIMAWLILPLLSIAQHEGEVEQLINVPAKFFSAVNRKASKLDARLMHQAEKYLRRFAKKEEKLRNKLSRIDTAAAKEMFSGSSAHYEKLVGRIKSAVGTSGNLVGDYLPYTDSLNEVLSFLDNNKENLSKTLQADAGKALQQFQQLQGRFKGAEEAREFVRQRKQQLREMMGRYAKLPKSVTNGLNDFNKEVYYYSQQLREYREMLNDPDKLTQKALFSLNKVPAFQDFMKQHSQLSGLFQLPAGYGNAANLSGLQTRAQVQSLIQGQLSTAGAGGQQMLQQNLQAAQAELNLFKDKLKNLGSGGGDIEMPDFKPNSQRTKSFLQRLEIGTNLQSTKSGYYFPVTTDLGLSIGYKMGDKGTIGLGGSFKVGWGKDIKNVVVTSEGAGLRSFLDIKLKGSFFASGGFEYNYQPADTAATSINSDWSKSGLVGLTKVVSLKSKFFKKTKVQLLWDFLSYNQFPRTQAIKFRIGYAF